MMLGREWKCEREEQEEGEKLKTTGGSGTGGRMSKLGRTPQPSQGLTTFFPGGKDPKRR